MWHKKRPEDILQRTKLLALSSETYVEQVLLLQVNVKIQELIEELRKIVEFLKQSDLDYHLLFRALEMLDNLETLALPTDCVEFKLRLLNGFNSRIKTLQRSLQTILDPTLEESRTEVDS